MSDPRTRVDTAGSNHLDAFRLDERVALITGACSEGGIGREIGLAPAAAGASVGLADVNEDGIRAATRRLQATGGEAVPLRMDVTDPESVSTAVVTLKQELGPVGILVNNVAISRSTPIWEIDLEEFDRIMDVNVRGGFICLRAVLRGMMQRRRGRIV